MFKEIAPLHPLQVLLNVFQPEYVHMFETLLATPQPWLYLHIQLPGGVVNLGSPEWALPGVPGVEASPKGSRAALDGTLMRVVAVKRQQDARLALIVQGLSRAHVLRGTQALP
jgi:Lon protease-like protein